MKKAKIKAKIKAVMTGAITIIISVFITLQVVNVIRFPEKYFTTWKYQLKNDISNGNEAAIRYYNNNYIAKGVILFDEN